jgi:transposase
MIRQWERIRDHFPEERIADGRPGRKPIASRPVLEAVLWILNTGAQWHMLPQIRTTKLCTGAFRLGFAMRLCAGY